MEHDYIDENQVVERYLMDKLSADEAARFEEHYLHCKQCLEQLELGQAFRQGLREAAAEEAAAMALTQSVGLAAGWRRMRRSRQVAVLAAAAAAVVILLLPSGLLYQENQQLQQQLAAASPHLGAADPALVASLEERLGEQQAQLEQLRTQVQATSRSLAETLAQARRPQANTPIFALAIERGAGIGRAEPSHIVRLSGEPEWIVLSLELDAPVGERYGVILQGPDGGQIWSGDHLVPNSYDSLTLSLHSSVLFEGVHEARVEAIAGSGQRVPAGTFRFRVVAGR